MKKRYIFAAITKMLVIAAAFSGCGKRPDILPAVPEGAQAVSLTGAPLFAESPYENTLQGWEKAKKAWEAHPGDADQLIWFGRWTAYKGDFREAVRIFTKGIDMFPDDARFYRHRGHRYISIREFDRAVKDFTKAAGLIKGQADEIEPDGQPNPLNIPVSTLHTNIWYHLGLAYYLQNDLENAKTAWKNGIAASANDDMLTAMTHWYYLTLRRLDLEADARKILEPIHKDMHVIENEAYHRLCLFYKGEISQEQLSGAEDSNIMNAAAAYGLAAWLQLAGRENEALKVYKSIFENSPWASFGYIAAEADAVHFNLQTRLQSAD